MFKEFHELIDIIDTETYDLVSENAERVLEAIKEGYRQGTEDEQEIAEYFIIRLNSKTRKYEFLIPKGITSSGKDFSDVISAREYGSFDIKAEPIILRLVR